MRVNCLRFLLLHPSATQYWVLTSTGSTSLLLSTRQYAAATGWQVIAHDGPKSMMGAAEGDDDLYNWKHHWFCHKNGTNSQTLYEVLGACFGRMQQLTPLRQDFRLPAPVPV